MLDVIQVVFWSITYVLIVIAGVKSRKIRKVSMPYAALILNFTWEVCALWCSRGYYSHILWASLDIPIVYFGYRYLKTSDARAIYILSLLIGFLSMLYIYPLPNGALFSVFIIDLIMAICFLVERKKLSPYLKTPIAVTKLLGDAFAGLCYAPASDLVAVIALLVFACNVCYLGLCLMEPRESRKAGSC